FEAEVAPDKKVMALDVLDRTVDAIVSRHPGGSLAVHWFGGEPLLRFGHIRRGVERFAGALMSGAVRSVHHAITTHGGLVDQERAEFLGRHRFSAYVSVDGDRDVNDINRLTRQGASTFDAAIRGYKTLSACGVDTGFLLTPH